MSLIEKAKELFSTKQKFEVTAYVELPVGKHIIDGKEYTVVEIIENEGLEDEYKKNIIESIVPINTTEAETTTDVNAAEITDTTTEETDVKTPEVDADIEKRVSELETVVMQLLEKISTMESDKEVVTQEMSKIKQDNEALAKSVPATVTNNFAKLAQTNSVSTDKPVGKYTDLILQGKIK
jgi:hypothetical protein